MNHDNLNIEIRKFLKKVGISSQRLIETSVIEQFQNGSVKIGTPQLARMVRRAAWIKLVKIQHRTKKNKKS